MLSRTQVTLDVEMQRRARRRANDLGISLAEYLRRLLSRDLAHSENSRANVERVFDLGKSGNSDIARNKDHMIASAAAFSRTRSR